MSRHLMFALLVSLFAVSSVSTLSAQDAPKKVGKATKKEKAPAAYKGGAAFTSPKAYTITPPAGWTSVSAYMTEEQLAQLPEKVRAQFRPEQVDVLFMDQAEQKLGSSFGDNVNVVVIAEVVPLDDKTVSELKIMLTAEYSKVFDAFKMTDFTVIKLGAKPALRVQGTYQLNGVDLHLNQTFIPGKTNSLVVTCTMDRARAKDRTPLCDGAAASVTFQ